MRKRGDTVQIRGWRRLRCNRKTVPEIRYERKNDLLRAQKLPIKIGRILQRGVHFLKKSRRSPSANPTRGPSTEKITSRMNLLSISPISRGPSTKPRRTLDQRQKKKRKKNRKKKETVTSTESTQRTLLAAKRKSGLSLWGGGKKRKSPTNICKGGKAPV